MNKKTLHRFFYVFGVLIMLSCLLLSVTPLSFGANVPVDSTIYSLPIDRSFPTLSSYFYGANSGLIDFKTSSGWYRFCINNTMAYFSVRSESDQYGTTHYYINFNYYNSNNSIGAWTGYKIGSSYSASTPFTSTSWGYSTSTEFELNSPIYINSCNSYLSTPLSTSTLSHCDFNSYYPFSSSSEVNRAVQTIIDNQESIASSQEDQANSRQSEIMDAGSDVTVSTVDDWVNGQNGLAGKLTELAATLSSNADIFSQNQSQNQENLSKAGAFVGNVFNQIPAGVTAAAVCFLIILIAVKVVGR